MRESTYQAPKAGVLKKQMPTLVSKYVSRQDGQLADADLRQRLTFEMNAHAQRITSVEQLKSCNPEHLDSFVRCKADEYVEYPRR